MKDRPPYINPVPSLEDSIKDLKIRIHAGAGSMDELKRVLNENKITLEEFNTLRDEFEERLEARLKESESTAGRLLTENEHLRIALEKAGADELTGLHTRRFFKLKLIESIEELTMVGDKRPSSTRAGVVLVLIDIDNLKKFNDINYTLVGDLVIVALAERLSGIFREGDVLARYGGDEFAVLINIDSANDITDEKLKERIEWTRQKINDRLFIKADVKDTDGNIINEILPITAAVGFTVLRKSKDLVEDKKSIPTIDDLMIAANVDLDKDKKDLILKGGRIAKAREALGLKPEVK